MQLNYYTTRFYVGFKDLLIRSCQGDDDYISVGSALSVKPVCDEIIADAAYRSVRPTRERCGCRFYFVGYSSSVSMTDSMRVGFLRPTLIYYDGLRFNYYYYTFGDFIHSAMALFSIPFRDNILIIGLMTDKLDALDQTGNYNSIFFIYKLETRVLSFRPRLYFRPVYAHLIDNNQLDLIGFYYDEEGRYSNAILHLFFDEDETKFEIIYSQLVLIKFADGKCMDIRNYCYDENDQTYYFSGSLVRQNKVYEIFIDKNTYNKTLYCDTYLKYARFRPSLTISVSYTCRQKCPEIEHCWMRCRLGSIFYDRVDDKLYVPVYKKIEIDLKELMSFDHPTLEDMYGYVYHPVFFRVNSNIDILDMEESLACVLNGIINIKTSALITHYERIDEETLILHYSSSQLVVRIKQYPPEQIGYVKYYWDLSTTPPDYNFLLINLQSSSVQKVHFDSIPMLVEYDNRQLYFAFKRPSRRYAYYYNSDLGYNGCLPTREDVGAVAGFLRLWRIDQDVDIMYCPGFGPRNDGDPRSQWDYLASVIRYNYNPSTCDIETDFQKTYNDLSVETYEPFSEEMAFVFDSPARDRRSYSSSHNLTYGLDTITHKLLVIPRE